MHQILHYPNDFLINWAVFPEIGMLSAINTKLQFALLNIIFFFKNHDGLSPSLIRKIMH